VCAIDDGTVKIIRTENRMARMRPCRFEFVVFVVVLFYIVLHCRVLVITANALNEMIRAVVVAPLWISS